MEWLWLGFGVLGGWAMLSLMGNERQRLVYAEEARLAVAKAAAAKAAATPAPTDLPAH